MMDNSSNQSDKPIQPTTETEQTFRDTLNNKPKKQSKFVKIITTYATTVMASLTCVTLLWSVISFTINQKKHNDELAYRNVEMEMARMQSEVTEIKDVCNKLLNYSLSDQVEDIIVRLPASNSYSQLRNQIGESEKEFKANYAIFEQTILPYGIPTKIESQNIDIEAIYDTLLDYSQKMQDFLWFFELLSNQETDEDKSDFIRKNAANVVKLPPVPISYTIDGESHENEPTNFAQLCEIFEYDFDLIKTAAPAYLYPIYYTIDEYVWNLGYYMQMVIDCKVSNLMRNYRKLGLATDDSIYYNHFLENYDTYLKNVTASDDTDTTNQEDTASPK